jgi:hypothetical protein
VKEWGFNYILTKNFIKRATADVGFIFVAYNLRKIINIGGIYLFYFRPSAILRQLLNYLG